jgi:hypothetical protein
MSKSSVHVTAYVRESPDWERLARLVVALVRRQQQHARQAQQTATRGSALVSMRSSPACSLWDYAPSLSGLCAGQTCSRLSASG